MPAITVGTSAVSLYTSRWGDARRPSRLIVRTDPNSTATVYLGTEATVTAGTNAATDGIPVLASEPFTDNMLAGDNWFIISDTPSTTVYYEVNGAQ